MHIGVVSITGYSLKFHKTGLDGSAKCNIVETGLAGDRVYGVVYEILDHEKERLDRSEGLGLGYLERQLDILLVGQQHRVFTYQADAAFINDDLLPYDWYRDLVWQGASYHGLPAAYTANIKSIDSMRDPDPGRQARHETLLADIGHYKVDD